ncbi:MAG: hypothetical protein JNL70_06080 [Saprospiraceae bacterium]|nr:hypothetical protein [Saprospiraceae bacterium]
MNFKKKIIILPVFVLGFLSMTYSQVLFQALLINGKDTLIMPEKLLDYSLKMTSIFEDMEFKTCLGGSFLPTWQIENDSLFLIEILLDRNHFAEDRDSLGLLDLQKEFKERCVNGRVFGKEINYQIAAHHYTEYGFSDYNTQLCFTIKDGKVIDKGEFKDKTEYINISGQISEEDIAKNTDWKHLPDIAVERQVTIKITTDDEGKIISAIPVKNRNWYGTIKPEGEEVWKQEALRQVKLIPKWNIYYKCGQVVDKEHEIVFLFSKPR